LDKPPNTKSLDDKMSNHGYIVRPQHNVNQSPFYGLEKCKDDQQVSYSPDYYKSQRIARVSSQLGQMGDSKKSECQSNIKQ